MRRLSLLFSVLAVAFASGCSYAMRPVAFDASRADWERLAGDWRGEYTMSGRERRGLIEFRLKASEHTASGDVLMIADRFTWPGTGMPHRDGPVRQPPADPQLLTIRFVEAAGGEIRGNLDPYWTRIGTAAPGRPSSAQLTATSSPVRSSRSATTALA